MMPPVEELIKEGLRRGDRRQIKEIYRLYHERIVIWIKQNKGSREEAEDVFQDALTVIYQKFQDPDFSIDHRFYTYLFSICRNLWLKRLRDDKLKTAEDSSHLEELAATAAEDTEVLNLKEQIFRRKFARLGKSCREIIQLSVKGLSPLQIAEKLSLKSERHASNRKSYCKQQLSRMVREDPLYKELLT